jgi:hypothetical protein
LAQFFLEVAKYCVHNRLWPNPAPGINLLG